MREPIVVYHSRAKMGLVALGSFLFVIAATFVAYIGFRTRGTSSLLYIALCLSGMPFFGVCFLYALKRLRKQTPALIINRDGIYDDASAVGGGHIAWEEIAALHIGQMGMQRFLCVVPTDLEGFLSRQPLWKRRLMRSNVSLVGAPMTISTVTLPMSIEDLQTQIEIYMGAHRSHIVLW